MSSTTLMYADDTKIIASINPLSYSADTSFLQNDLDTITSWTSTWLMELNSSKCKLIHFGKNNRSHNYPLNDPLTKTKTTLDKSISETDLGIIISTNLKPSAQFQKAASKANSMLGLIKRTFVSRNMRL